MTAGIRPQLRLRQATVARAAVAALLAISTMALAGCGSGAQTAAPATAAPTNAPASPAPTAGDSAVPSDATGVPVPDSPVAGIVVDITSAGLSQVTGFTLRTNDGETIAFTIGTLENGDEFPPGHLKEHQAAASPVLVFFREANGQLVVYRIEDAG